MRSCAGELKLLPAPSIVSRHVLVVDLQGRKWEVDNVDPDGAEKITGGRLRVRKLPVEEALRKYGHDAQHHAPRV